MNRKQIEFLKEIQYIGYIDSVIYAIKKNLHQKWQEQFKSTKIFALDLQEVGLSDFDLTYDDIKEYATNQLKECVTFFDGGSTLANKERGKFSRLVENSQTKTNFRIR